MADASPVTIAYFYRIRWGFHEEFWELFTRNHYPILAAQVESGPAPRGPRLRSALPR